MIVVIESQCRYPLANRAIVTAQKVMAAICANTHQQPPPIFMSFSGLARAVYGGRCCEIGTESVCEGAERFVHFRECVYRESFSDERRVVIT